MRYLTAFTLAALAALVTGCPHNEYTLDLTPRGTALERTLAFCRVDGTNADGSVKYCSFPSNELAQISKLYTKERISATGDVHVAKAEFAGAMPADIGGNGNYRQFTTTLGSASLYGERFRGDDDAATQVEERLKAAEELAGLVRGWCKMEFSAEPGYTNLSRFLEDDFPRDLKNLALCIWAGQPSLSMNPDSENHGYGRLVQYLIEHGYLKLDDAPSLTAACCEKDSCAMFYQHILAQKLGAPASGMMPNSLAALGKGDALAESWNRYLSGTDQYREVVLQWEKDKQEDPKSDKSKPEPSKVSDKLLESLTASGTSGDDDLLKVRLSLPGQPVRTNGKWDSRLKQVIWESPLESSSNSGRMPVFCYAIWSAPLEGFQTERFGRVILKGAELLQYCLWHNALSETQAREWEKMLLQLRPGMDLTNQFSKFRFSGEPEDESRIARIAVDLLNEAIESNR